MTSDIHITAEYRDPFDHRRYIKALIALAEQLAAEAEQAEPDAGEEAADA